MKEKAKYYKLKNNLSICLVKVPDAFVVNMLLVVNTGFAYENDNTLGYSHLLEHILMESNPKHTKKNTWEEIEKKGIIANASTDNEIVDYTYMGSSKHWKTIFDFVTIPITGIKMSKDIFNRELQAVKQELNKVLDEKLRNYHDKIKSIIYKNTVLNHSEHDVLANTMKCKMKELIKFFEEQYVCENMTLLVVGNYPEKELINYIKKLEKVNRTNIHNEHPENKMKHNHNGNVLDILNRNYDNCLDKTYIKLTKVNNVYVKVMYKLDVVPYSTEYYIIKFVSRILTDGMMSVLYKKLRIDKKWVYGVSSKLLLSNYDSNFVIKFETEPKHLKNCVEEIFKSINTLKNNINKQIYKLAYEKIKTDYDLSHTDNRIDLLVEHYEDLIKFNQMGKNMLSIDKFYENLLKVKQQPIKKFLKQNFIKNNCKVFYGSKKNTGKQIRFM